VTFALIGPLLDEMQKGTGDRFQLLCAPRDLVAES
jgi:hypothetical protein